MSSNILENQLETQLETQLPRLLDQLEAQVLGELQGDRKEKEALIAQLPEAFIAAVDSAGPGVISASLDRLDGLLRTTALREENPALFGMCLGLRPQLSAASGRLRPDLDSWAGPKAGLGIDLDESISAGLEAEVTGFESASKVGCDARRPLAQSVAELFRWAGYVVEPFVDSSDGPGLELLKIEHVAGPMRIHALVCCIDRLPKLEDILKVATTIESLRQSESLPYRGVVVLPETGCDATPSWSPDEELAIREAAREHWIELSSENLMLCSLVDIEAAVAHAERPFRGTELEIRYVDPEMVLERDLASDEPAAARELLSWVREWMDGDGTFLALLGDFGVGKTSFCRRLAADLGDEWTPGQRLPVLVDLREHLTGSTTLEGLLARHFRDAGIRAAHSAALLRLCFEGHLLLILDGFGEMVAHAETGLHLASLRRLLGFARGRAKVVLTCRTHYFRDSPEEVWQLGATAVHSRGATPLLAELESRPDAEIAYLRELDSARIESYLRRAVPDEFERLNELLKNSYHLESLARRPFLLRMIIEALPSIESNEGDASLAGLYESYCAQWLIPSSGSPAVDQQARERLVELLAREIWSGTEERVAHLDLISALDPDVIMTPTDREILDKGPFPRAVKDLDDTLRRAPFLNRDSKGRYGFVHRSFLEFFLARSLRRGFALGEIACLDIPSVTREVAFFLECWQGTSEIPRFTGRVLGELYRPRISENALLLLMFHARSRLGPLLGPGAQEVEVRLPLELPQAFSAVRPSMLNLRGADFTGMDLRALDLASADLREAMLERADLRHCRFDGADLGTASLYGADLRQAQLEGTSLEEVDLRHADLRDADIRLARCARADFTEANIEGMVADGASFLATLGLPKELLVSTVEVSPVFQSGHSWRVCDVAWHPELPLIASAAEDGTILVWNVANNRLLRRLSGHGRAVNSVAWDAEGKRLATGSDDRSVRIWDAEKGHPLHVLVGHGAGVSDVSWDGQGRRLASASEDHTVRLWDASNGECLQVLEGHSDRVNSVAWDAGSDRVATGSDDWTVRLWDAELGEAIQVFAGHSDGVHALDWSPGGRRLASGSDDWTVRIWNPKTGRSTRTLSGHSEGVHAVAWHPGGERLASGAFDRSIRLWDADTGRALEKLVGHSGWVRALSWSPTGRRLASGASSRAVRLWDVEGRRSTHRLAGFAGWINTVAWDPEGRRIAAGSSGRAVRVWNREDGSSRVLEGHEDRVHTVAWDPTGMRIASGADDRTVRIWNAETGATEHVLEGHAGWIRAVVWDPDGHRLASGADDRIVRIWDSASGTCLRTLDGHSGWVRALAWDPANQYLASGADDGTIKLWHVGSGQQTHTLGGHSAWVLSIAWDPEGTRLASGTGNGQVRIWDTEAGRKTHQLEGHDSWVHTVAWNEAGDRLLSASVDGLVRISDPRSGTCLQTLEVGFVWHAAWRGDQLALAVPEGKVSLWRVNGSGGKPQPIADLWGTPEGGLVVSSDGYVDGDAEAMEWIRFVDDGWAVYELGELPDRHDFDRVRRALARS